MDYPQSMKRILRGVVRFEEKTYPQKISLFSELAYTQKPKTLFIACSDSRVVPNLITQMEPGEIFVMRNIGNIIPAEGYHGDNVSAVLEYAVKCLKVENIIVCGHSNCGAIKTLAKSRKAPQELAKIPAIKRWLEHAQDAHVTTSAQEQGGSLQDMSVLSKANVRLQIEHLKTYSFIREALNAKSLGLHGWYYDIKNGKVQILDTKINQEYSATELLATS